jgi:hypothetical protein
MMAAVLPSAIPAPSRVLIPIAQFPKGSRFVMTNTTPQTEEQKRLDDRVKDLLEEHGMTAERDPH